MGIKDRLREVQEHDAREAREAEIAAQRDRKRYEERTVFIEHWGKITQAIVESGKQPSAHVATPEGIALGNIVISNKPTGTHTWHLFNSKPSYYPPAQESLEEWANEVRAARGQLQPAWDMQSYAEVVAGPKYVGDNGPQFQFSRSGSKFDRLFLAQDATIYKRAVIDPLHYGVSGNNYFPISSAMEMNDATHLTIEQALAHMVVRRELEIDF
jgi:hypothetical protein